MKKFVFIVESLRDDDYRKNFDEGSKIKDLLDQKSILNYYSRVRNVEELKKAFSSVGKQVLAYERDENSNERLLCYIHFSCHGDQDQIQLNSYECVSWDELEDLMFAFNYNVGTYSYFDQSKNNKIVIGGKYDYCNTIITFSACESTHFSTHEFKREPTSFSFVFGSSDKIGISESLGAFSFFYHNIDNQNLTFIEIVEGMQKKIFSKTTLTVIPSKEFSRFLPSKS